MMLSKPSNIHTLLLKNFRSNTVLRDNILNAVRDVLDCQIAYHKPFDGVQRVIFELQASLATSKRSMPNFKNSLDNPTFHYVVCRYVRIFLNNRPHNRDSCSRKCIVSKRPGSWPTNHLTKERLEAFKKNKMLRPFITLLSIDDSDEND